MSEISYRTRKIQYSERSAVGNDFARWLTGAYMEECAKKIADYCNSIKNCEDCQFFNGTCRLNRYPWDWDMRNFEEISK